jgi:membrane dipeptidase
VLATSPEALLVAKQQGRLALLAVLEGGDGLEARVENLRDLYRRGLRLLQLVHFRGNTLGHIQTYPYSPGGLAPFGREAVHEVNRLGIIIDLAHANTETIMDAVKESSQPVLFNHTGVKTLHDGDRYLAGDEIVAIASNGESQNLGLLCYAAALPNCAILGMSVLAGFILSNKTASLVFPLHLAES